ncbi:hypothetical protein NDU88_002275 [Pleurodeles waltl]|uniref:Secreted protein n=1 Tax=Pleurodeles waltl TaxID=8319 RepID=A0AAV7Q5H9_PLEWA|nr:hypothetical protein NDU88_002275 [Pleurodeles waltl]
MRRRQTCHHCCRSLAVSAASAAGPAATCPSHPTTACLTTTRPLGSGRYLLLPVATVAHRWCGTALTALLAAARSECSRCTCVSAVVAADKVDSRQ